MNTRFRRSAILIGITSLIGCAVSDDRSGSRPSVELTLGPELLRIGSEVGYPLHNVIGGFEDLHDRLFVIQFSTPHVSVFDARGELISELGRPGSGPGTFLFPSGVGGFGDSVWVSDARLRKIALYDSDLKHVRDVILPQQSLRPVAMLASDQWIAVASTPNHTEWFSVVSGRNQLLYSQSTESRVVNFEYDGRFISVLNPLSDDALVVSAPVGPGIIVLQPTPEHVRLRHFSVTADTLLDLSLPIAPQPITDEWYAEIVDRLSVPPSPRMRSALTEALPQPESAHALAGALVGLDGTLWFGQYLRDGSRWHAVRLDTGLYLGFVDLPAGHEIRSGNADYVWVVELDENDVQYLVKRSVTASSVDRMRE